MTESQKISANQDICNKQGEILIAKDPATHIEPIAYSLKRYYLWVSNSMMTALFPNLTKAGTHIEFGD